jgi:hypothetical protein
MEQIFTAKSMSKRPMTLDEMMFELINPLEAQAQQEYERVTARGGNPPKVPTRRFEFTDEGAEKYSQELKAYIAKLQAVTAADPSNGYQGTRCARRSATN